MKEQFQNLDIECWEHVGGRLGIKPPFLCLQAGSPAGDVLLAALDELAAEGEKNIYIKSKTIINYLTM